MQEIVLGTIEAYQEDGSVLIRAPLPSMERAAARSYQKVQVGFCDSRHISPDQRAKTYALIGEIADWSGDDQQSMKETMKMDFIMNRLQNMQRRMFSLSDVDMNTASEFISYLIDFIIHHGIPTKRPLVELAEDIERYVYACLLHKKCCVCGQSADLHHTDRIGMGNDRTQVAHIGRLALPLCRGHHTEIHGMAEQEFYARYHIGPIRIDKAIAKAYKLKG